MNPNKHTLATWLTTGIATLVISTMALSARAQESDWQNSYTLETAGKYTEAIAALDAVPANGAEAELKLLRRGWLFYLAGQHNESIREYRLAGERNAKSVDARLGLTLPLLAQKRWREAALAANSALQLAPNHYTALLRLAVAQEGERDWDSMLKTASALVAAYPSDATAWVYLARAQAWLGKRADASAAYAAVLVRYPGHTEARAWLDAK